MMSFIEINQIKTENKPMNSTHRTQSGTWDKNFR